MSIWTKFKKAVMDLLKNMEKENQKTFGSERLDCCQLNRNDTNKEK